MATNFIRNFYHNTELGYKLLHPLKKIYFFLKYDLQSDEAILKKKFRKSFGRNLDLKNPKTLNEKIIWLKLNDRTQLHTLCADKIAVHDFVREKVGDKYLIPMYFTTSNPKEIIPKNIPDFPVIIKTNHDSGGGIFVRDKSTMDWKQIQRDLSRRLKENYYQRSKEWQYKNIEPKILVEKLLVSSDGSSPNDYKFHCFNGVVRMIQVDIGRGTPNHCRNWYDRDWNREPYKWSSKLGNNKFTDPSVEDVPKPLLLKEMIEVSEKIASSFDYARVDLYSHENQVYFGEVTFHHDGGTKPILPKEWDYKLGEELKLKLSKNN